MGDRSYLSIGEVLSLLQPEFDDLTISKIRFLESQGLLEPERTPSGYRKFYENDVERLRWILRQQREQYLPLKVIRGRLGEPEGDAGPEADAGEDGGSSPTPAAAASEAAPADSTGSAAAIAEPEIARPVPPPESQPPPSDRSPAKAASDTANPLAPARSGVSLTAEELCSAAGLEAAALTELERYGLVSSRPSGSAAYYDEEALTVAKLASRFMAHGVEARHLRMYKTAAEREAGVFEQLVMPLLRQRNPRARREAMERLTEIARLGQELRAAMLRTALRDELG